MKAISDRSETTVRTEDGYIVHKCLNGEKEAFGLLVDKYKEGVYALAYSKLSDFQDAQDVVQEVFIKAYRKLNTLRRWDSFMAWLYAITSNMCKDWIRRQSKRPDCAFVEDQEPAVIDRASLDSYSEELALRSIRDVLDSLPKTYHQVLALFYLGGMSVKEIAGFLGTPPRTVERRLREARAQLKEEMLAEMKTTFDEHRLHGGFTFVIVEAVKRMKIQPMPRTAGLPWGLSLATGIILMFVCLGSHLNMLSSSSFLPGSPLPAETKVP